eukprot:8489153-Pyramimonas_sp.AAC.1
MPLPLECRLQILVKHYGCIDDDGRAAITNIYELARHFEDDLGFEIRDAQHVRYLVQAKRESFLARGSSKKWPKYNLDVIARILEAMGAVIDEDEWIRIRVGECSSSSSSSSCSVSFSSPYSPPYRPLLVRRRAPRPPPSGLERVVEESLAAPGDGGDGPSGAAVAARAARDAAARTGAGRGRRRGGGGGEG